MTDVSEQSVAKVSLTLEQIRSIYKAGMKRGEDYAASFDRGSMCAGKVEDDLAEALHEMANEGITWGSEHYITYADAPTLFAQMALRQTSLLAAPRAGEGVDRG